MPRITLNLLFLTLIFFSHRSVAAFLSFNGGYEQFSTKVMQSNNASAKGTNYQFELGAQMRYTILTFYVKKSNLTTELVNDENNFKFGSEHLSYGIKASFTISKQNYLSLGYNISNIENDFSKISNFDASGIKQANGLDDTQSANGVVLGLGRNFYKRRKISIFGEYNYTSHSNIQATTQSIFFGLRYKVNIKI